MSFPFLLGCKWISTKSKLNPAVTSTAVDAEAGTDAEKGMDTPEEKVPAIEN